MQLIRPNPRQLLYLAGTLGLLSLLLPVAFERPLHQFWIEHWIAPKLQHDLGFTAGYREVAPGQGPAFMLLAVTPGGRLYRAGFRAGDISVGYQHGFVSGFYDDLWRSLTASRWKSPSYLRAWPPEAPKTGSDSEWPRESASAQPARWLRRRPRGSESWRNSTRIGGWPGGVRHEPWAKIASGEPFLSSRLRSR